jgi:2-isopropylmalate synthase
MGLDERELIYDWNLVDHQPPPARPKVTFWDETLRDGIQSPSITDPSIEVKLKIVHLMHAIGVETADVGLPGAGLRAVEHVERLVREIVEQKLDVEPAAAARTHLNDVRPIAEISQRTGRAIEAATFIGSSPIRLYAESWDVDRMLRMSAEALDFCAAEGLPVLYVTEDTVRSRPSTLRALLRNAIDHGAARLCLCDTVGHATPQGVRNLVAYAKALLRAWDAEHIGLDWHGHNDRGLGVANNLAAWEAGAGRIHGTILGVGERVGNASLDQTLVNMKLMGELDDRDLGKLPEYCELVGETYGVPIVAAYPVVGLDAFRTTTGVHAAAIIKAEKKGDSWLADRIYSGIPAAMFGREQLIEIGPMSGASNVVYWLKKRGIEPADDLVERIFAAAKTSDRTLTDDEVFGLIGAAG